VSERTDFLYPFIEGEGDDPAALLADLARSAESKADESAALATATLTACDHELDRIATAMADRLRGGATLFTFGNGGSSTDADTVAALFAQPPVGRAFPARNLASDPAVLTALANDVGFDLVFARQLMAHARPSDIALGISTSGDSRDVLVAFAEAKQAGLLTVGLAGYEGGSFATSADVDHCLVVHAASVHRIQETQAVMSFELWDRIQRLVAR